MKLKALALGSGILVALAVAAFAVSQWIATPPGPGRVGEPLMTGVDAAQVRKIEIVAPQHTVTLTSEDGTLWRVAEQEGFPVETRKIKSLFFKLSNEKLAHKVTDNPDRLGDLGLLTREENEGRLEADKTGRLVRLYSAGDAPLFSLLIGRERRAQGGMAFGGVYVRYPESSAAYLISESVLGDFRPQDWIETVVLELEADKAVKALRVERPGQRPVRLSREKPGEPWKMAGLTADNLSQEQVQRVAAQLAGLDIFKVRPGNAPAEQTGRARTGRLEFELFDQRRFTLDIGEAKADDDFRYLTLHAELDPSVKDAALREQVRAFNERFEGLLLAVYDWDAGRMLQGFEEYRVKEGGR